MLVAALDLGVFDASARPRAGSGRSCRRPRAASHRRTSPGCSTRWSPSACWTASAVGSSSTTSRDRYLTGDGAASMAGLVAVAPGPPGNWTQLADTVRRRRAGRAHRGRPRRVLRARSSGPRSRRSSGRRPGPMRMVGYSRRPRRGCSTSAPAGRRGRSRSSVLPGRHRGGQRSPGVIEWRPNGWPSHGVADRVELRRGDFHDVIARGGVLRSGRARPRLPDRGRGRARGAHRAARSRR